MDAAELARWTRFAAKGGIGKCTAVNDCVAEGAEDLMFLKVCRVSLLQCIVWGSHIVGISFVALCTL